MRLSDLKGKEVINLGDGVRLGFIDECDLVFDSYSGRINALLVPRRSWFSLFGGDGRSNTIPWQAIRRIGDEVIIVDLNHSYERMHVVLSDYMEEE
ncbi:MAG: sporulation protein, YlmC/YmxH family [Firmicutes bacterium]|nr:sporulation protein, YlmC/YmxH family [Bacillota bacterium]